MNSTYTSSIVRHVAEARAWITHYCDELPGSLTNGEVIDGITLYYAGGWPQFHRDAGRELAAQAAEWA